MNETESVDTQPKGLVYLTLNPKSELFSKLQNRQWIQKKLLYDFKINKDHIEIARKAIQFFLPKAKGYIKFSEVKANLSHFETYEVPNDLKNGITIQSITANTFFLPDDFQRLLSEALGIKVTLDFSITSKDSQLFRSTKPYEATIIDTAMNPETLDEVLYSHYMPNDPTFVDPSGQIKKLLTEYRTKTNLNKKYKLINTILKQMVTDSECIPLYYYFSTPLFVNN